MRLGLGTLCGTPIVLFNQQERFYALISHNMGSSSLSVVLIFRTAY
jgi:hypothetical protein